jgi:hypothetical protein
MTLAQDMAAAVDADVDHRDALIAAALCAGEWLAEEGLPGRWDRLDPAALLRAMDFQDRREGDALLLTLSGLVGYAALEGALPVRDARRVLLEIEALSQDPAVQQFAAQAVAAIAAPPEALSGRSAGG